MKEEKLEIHFEIIKKLPYDLMPVLKNQHVNDENILKSSRFEINNPEADFPKTYLELLGDPKHLIGRYVSENGSQDNCFLLMSNTENCVSFNQKINDIAYTENNSIWILTSRYISYSQKNNSEEKRFPLTGMKIVGSRNDATWVVGLNEAWFLDSEFNDPMVYPWNGGIHTIENEGRIAAFNKLKDKIIWLDKDGTETLQAVVANHGLFENLVGIWDSKYMTIESSTFRIYDSLGIQAELPLQSVGLLDNGEPFISFSKNRKTFLISNNDYIKWEFPLEFTNLILPVVAKTETQFLGYHLGVFGKFDIEGGVINSIENIHEVKYKELIDSKRWKLGQSRYYSVFSENEIIVSITGPDGVTIIKIIINT